MLIFHTHDCGKGNGITPHRFGGTSEPQNSSQDPEETQHTVRNGQDKYRVNLYRKFNARMVCFYSGIFSNLWTPNLLSEDC